MKYIYKDEVIVIELQLSIGDIDEFTAAFKHLEEDGNPYVVEKLQPIREMIESIKYRKL